MEKLKTPFGEIEILIDGKATATAIKAEIAEEVKKIVAQGGKQPQSAQTGKTERSGTDE